MSDFFGRKTSSMDIALRGDDSVQRFANPLTDKDIQAGTRVSFICKLSNILAYPDGYPDPSVTGTVVTVRTAGGYTTNHNGAYFVKYDDGSFIPTFRDHIRIRNDIRVADSYRRVVSSLDLSEFMKTASSGDELIHKATRDLWSLKHVGGQYVIERLFDDQGTPLKV